MTLLQAQEGKEYIIEQINTDDEELNAFLFSLGCYSGEKITVITLTGSLPKQLLFFKKSALCRLFFEDELATANSKTQAAFPERINIKVRT